MPDRIVVDITPPKPLNTFTRRVLKFTFQLAAGAFASGGNTLDITGYRASATISKAGGISMSTLEARIFGIPLDVMNRLTILGTPFQGSKANYVTVTADGAVCFEGTIAQAWVDAEGAPDVSLIVMANTGGLDKLKPVPPSSYKGTTKAADIISDMASRLVKPLPVANNGVDRVLTNPYLSGCLYDQMHEIAQQADFSLTFDDQEIAIWPNNGARSFAATTISVETGMVGYPVHTDHGIVVQTLFNPAIRIGDQVNIISILTPANGFWKFLSLTHELESETPNGKWFSSMDCDLFQSGRVSQPEGQSSE